MIEVRVPRDIRAYKSKIILGLSAKQALFLLLTGLVVSPIYIYIKPIIGKDLAGYLIMLIGGPLLLCGFYPSKESFPFEKYFIYFFRFYFTKPRKRIYQVEKILGDD